MSKMDAQRAMREAKYARMQGTTAPQRKEAGVPVAPSAGAKPATTRSRKTAPSAAPSAEEGAETSPAAEQLCGHKSMNGRTCTREHGHSAKSHRYS